MRISSILAVALGVTSLAGAALAQNNNAPVLPRWMAGCWLTEAGQPRRMEECWTMPRGSMMLGSSQTFDAEKTRSFEHMRIVRDADGLAFIGQPDGAQPTRFTLDRQSATELSFVNAAHDYPQRITYRVVDGELVAEIALLDGSKPQRWTYSRE